MFRHFAFPDSHRLKLSQIIVLKPHQRQGVASRLLSAVTHMAIASGAKDVTVRNPDWNCPASNR